MKPIVEVVFPPDCPRAIKSTAGFPASPQVVSSHQCCCLNKEQQFLFLFKACLSHSTIMPLYLCSIHVKLSGEKIQHLVSVHFNLGKVEKFWLLGGCGTVSPAPFKGRVWQWGAFGLESQSAVMKNVH